MVVRGGSFKQAVSVIRFETFDFALLATGQVLTAQGTSVGRLWRLAGLTDGNLTAS